MADIVGGTLGKASLQLEANFSDFDAGMQAARGSADRTQSSLDALAEVSRIAKQALGDIKISSAQDAESRVSAQSILAGVRGISEEARTAAVELDRVRITDTQAAESAAAGEEIKHNVADIGDQADKTRRKLEEVKLAGGRNGVGVGPFGSGFGRIGLLGTAVGAGALTAPVGGAAAAGLLAAIPAVAAAGAGALGTLVLAFDGVTSAIGGSKAAFDDLGPAAQQFVLTVRSLDGEFDKLRQTAGENLFPGLEEALHSALSPGTVAAVTAAVKEFASAIGQAGEAWGRYFGSAEFQQIFGPVMAAGAHELGLMSDAALQLFDAFGTLARAALPLTTWLAQATDEGARFVDSWLHAKDATGQLGGAMNTAQTSLRLVAQLAEALIKAVAALGVALYPVAQVAVKDLTDGLNGLAGIIDRNQGTIRDLVSGALQALVGAVKIASDGVHLLVDAFSQMAGSRGPLMAAIVAIGVALTLSMGPEAAAITGAIAAVGLIRENWASFAAWITKTFDTVATGVEGAFDSMVNTIIDALNTVINGYNKVAGWATGNIPTIGKLGMPGGYYSSAGAAANAAAGAAVAAHGIGAGATPQHSSYTPADMEALWAEYATGAAAAPGVAAKMAQVGYYGESRGNPSIVNSIGATGLWQVLQSHNPNANYKNPVTNVKEAITLFNKAVASGTPIDQVWTEGVAAQLFPQTISSTTSPFGPSPPFTTTGTTTAKTSLIPASLADAVSKYKDLAKNLGDTGAQAKKYLDDEAAALKAQQAALKAMPQTDAVKKALTTVQNNLRDVQKQIADAIVVTGAALLPDSLKSKLAAQTAQFKADSGLDAILTGSVAQQYQTVILNDLKDQSATLTAEAASLRTKLAAATGKQKTAIQQELSKVTSSLSSVQQQVEQSLQGIVQGLQQTVGSAFSAVQSEMDAQFEAQTQAMIDRIGQQYYQNGLQTPLEAQLASMQYQDQLTQLQQAVSSATDPASLAQAQRALAEFNLEQEATAQRAQADKEYAAAVQQITTQRTAEENKMNTALAALSVEFQNGTANMDDLNALAAQYGITLDQSSIPDLTNLSTGMGDLQAALKNLVDYINSITGKGPSPPPGDKPPPGTAAAAAATAGVATAGQRPLPGHPLALAGGGIVLPRLGGTLARIAEAGVPEAVIPLPSLSTLTGARGGDVVLMVDGRELGRATVDAIGRDPVGAVKLAKTVVPASARVTRIGR